MINIHQFTVKSPPSWRCKNTSTSPISYEDFMKVFEEAKNSYLTSLQVAFPMADYNGLDDVSFQFSCFGISGDVMGFEYYKYGQQKEERWTMTFVSMQTYKKKKKWSSKPAKAQQIIRDFLDNGVFPN